MNKERKLRRSRVEKEFQESRARVYAVDSNHQVLMLEPRAIHISRYFEATRDEVLLYDYWNKNTAVCMIVTGCTDSEAHAHHVWAHENGHLNDWNLSVVKVIARALRIVESSIEHGAIRDPDTPFNWIAWAKLKGYSTSHLEHKSAKSKPAKQTVPEETVIVEERPVKITNTPSMFSMDDSKLVSMDNIAEAFGVVEATVYRWIKRDSFPEGQLLGRRLRRWSVGEVRAWKEQKGR